MYKTVQLLLVLIYRTILLGVVLVGGTLIFAEIEDHVDYEKAGHFCWTVVTTIGYGNIIPKSQWGKIFTIIYGFFGIPTALFCLSSYGAFLTHFLKKVIMLFEGCCCRKKFVRHINAKLFLSLLILALAEMFVGGYAMCLMYDWSYLDGLYAWFTTMTTIGFGDLVPGKPDQGIAYAMISFVCNLFSLVTLASLIEATQGMLSTVNNNKRGVCAILFCCYNDEEKDIYDIQSNSSSMYNLDLPKE